MELRAREGSPAARCPLCRDELGEPQDRVQCPGCRIDYHGECFEELGGCATAGCQHKPTAATRAARGRGRAEPTEAPDGALEEASRELFLRNVRVSARQRTWQWIAGLVAALGILLLLVGSMNLGGDVNSAAGLAAAGVVVTLIGAPICLLIGGAN